MVSTGGEISGTFNIVFNFDKLRKSVNYFERLLS